MRYSTLTATALLATAATAQETVLGVYIFSRHGDRTAKSTPPANLTDLGYQEVFTSGTYFRNRYVAEDATRRILGINSDLVRQSQLIASAPTDTVLQNSALGFLQGIYPPVGQQLGTNTLRNGTSVTSPLNGYQLIPLQTVETGANSENSAWLQGQTNCANAQLSSNGFFLSQEYLTTLNQTQSLYDEIYPFVNRTFSQSATSFKNAYTIWDLLNVASIHNSSSSAPLPTAEQMTQLKYLADQHEFSLAYNNTEPVRAITGSIIAAEVVEAFNATINSKGKSKLNIQFGAYAGMFSFFGLANLTQTDAAFYGVPDYASTLTWELVTNTSTSSWPSTDEISVRFLFHNGTTSNTSEPIEYPLFGGNRSPLPWTDFVAGMNKFAISDQEAWCQACGNSTGVCSSAYLNNQDDGLGGNNKGSSSNGGGMSKAVAGVIGAMVTLAVILGVQLLILLVGGFSLVSKKRLASQNGAATHTAGKA